MDNDFLSAINKRPNPAVSAPDFGKSPEAAASLNLLDLMALARLRAGETGPRPFTCAIINIRSGRCGEDCAFCAQSIHYNTGAPDYPMLKPEELLKRAEKAAGWGCRYLGLVSSGAGLGRDDFGRLLEMAAEIKKRFDLELCASIGSLDEGRASTLKEAGFASCHHNLETGPGFFSRICSTHSLDSRIQTVKTARRAGLRVCSGGLFGLGETWADRLELAELLKSLEVDSIPINFLMPMAGTPLGGRRRLPPAEALRIIALMRLINPQSDVVVCGGRESTLGALKNMCFSAGANGLMIGDYLTAKGGSPEDDLAELAALELCEKAAEPVAGRPVEAANKPRRTRGAAKLPAACFIAGTDTDVGKTMVTAGLLRLLEGSQAIKPVQTGASPDEAVYARAAPEARVRTLSRFQLAASPHLAAAREGRRLDSARLAEEIIRECAQARFTLIEGAGGIHTPLNPEETFLDLMVRLPFPVCLVVRNNLGAINQALLSAAALRGAGLKAAGLIINQTAPAGDDQKIILDDNLTIIPALSQIPLLSAIPYFPFSALGPDSAAGWNELTEHLRPAAERLPRLNKEN